MHAGPNLSALRMPVQFLTGCGSRQRKSPTGGAAKGMPLKLRTPSFGEVVDSRTPFAVFTRSLALAGSADAAHSARLGTINMVFIACWQKNITVASPAWTWERRTRGSL